MDRVRPVGKVGAKGAAAIAAANTASEALLRGAEEFEAKCCNLSSFQPLTFGPVKPQYVAGWAHWRQHVGQAVARSGLCAQLSSWRGALLAPNVGETKALVGLAAAAVDGAHRPHAGRGVCSVKGLGGAFAFCALRALAAAQRRAPPRQELRPARRQQIWSDSPSMSLRRKAFNSLAVSFRSLMLFEDRRLNVHLLCAEPQVRIELCQEL